MFYLIDINSLYDAIQLILIHLKEALNEEMTTTKKIYI